jgi:hypothetical protein
MGHYWSDEPKKFTIDLGRVTTPEQLRSVLAAHFDLWPDVREISCGFSLAKQEFPCHINILHWAELRRQMPRHARRLRRRFDEYTRRYGRDLVVDYGEGPTATAARPAEKPCRTTVSTTTQTDMPSANTILSGCVLRRLNYIVLEPIAKPTVQQMRTLRELSPPLECNMLGIRRVLQEGGYSAFGEMLEDRAKQISSRLSAVEIPHRIEKTPVRQVFFAKPKK